MYVSIHEYKLQYVPTYVLYNTVERMYDGDYWEIQYTLYIHYNSIVLI